MNLRSSYKRRIFLWCDNEPEWGLHDKSTLTHINLSAISWVMAKSDLFHSATREGGMKRDAGNATE